MKQFNSARKTCVGDQFLVTLQACHKLLYLTPSHKYLNLSEQEIS